MNLVPIALVADVSRTTLLVYVFMSSVLTALPMGIKGVELLMTADKRFESVVTRMSDASVEEESIVAEMWVVECRTMEEVRPIALAHVIVAFVMMVVGVVLEVVARVVMWRGTPWVRRKEWDEEEGFLDGDDVSEDDVEVRRGKDLVDDME